MKTDPLLATVLDMTEASVSRTNLSDRELMMVRLAALAAVNAPPASYLLNMAAVAAAGTDLTLEDAQGTLIAVAPVIGTPRTVSAGRSHRRGPRAGTGHRRCHWGELNPKSRSPDCDDTRTINTRRRKSLAPTVERVCCRRRETERQGRSSSCCPPVPSLVCHRPDEFSRSTSLPACSPSSWSHKATQGGEFRKRAEGMSAFALLGALVTAFGFYVGDKSWGFLVLAVFVLTLAGGLAVKLGVHQFAAGLLLNIWFLVVLSLATHDTGHLKKISAWDQALAWLIGAAASIGLMLVVWLASGGNWRPAPVMDLPGGQSPVNLTRPIVLFASHPGRSPGCLNRHRLRSRPGQRADWMPIATIAAMKPSLGQSKLFGEQRLMGAAMVAAAAIPILILVGSKHALGGHHYPPGRTRSSHSWRELHPLRRGDRLCRSYCC